MPPLLRAAALLAALATGGPALGLGAEARQLHGASQASGLRGFGRGRGDASAQLALDELGSGHVHQAAAAVQPDQARSSFSRWLNDLTFFGWTLHHLGGAIVFASFGAVLVMQIMTLQSERKNYDQFLAGGSESFSGYLKYRFADWFSTSQFAPSMVLTFLGVGLIVTGALFYSLILGESPAHALWRIFVWASASPAEGEVTPPGRFLGVCVTVCGMVILSLLFGIVSELFASKMNSIKTGTMKVVEGGHTVVLGWTECTRCLIEELSKAKESSGGGTFVILVADAEGKEEAEAVMRDSPLHGSRVLVRTGNPVLSRDLDKVAVQSASQLVILADTEMPPEEADAMTIRTLLTLKGRGWPTRGSVVAQCCCAANRSFMQDLYRAEIVVVGTIATKLMAQSALQPGLAKVFSMMLGFDGDEFYSTEWPELVGKTFKDVSFSCPDAVVVGIVDAEGACVLCPPWDYVIQKGDQMIVLAEDDDSYDFKDKLFYGDMRIGGESPRSKLKHGRERAADPSNILIVGWNNKCPQLLTTLDELVGDSSVVTIYSPSAVDDREVAIKSAHEGQFASLSIHHVKADEEQCMSLKELAKLRHERFDKIFMLAEGANHFKQDERTVAILAKLQALQDQLPDDERKFRFNPVIEMREDSTEEHLHLCHFENFVHSSCIVSQALAAVAEDPDIIGIYDELMGNPNMNFVLRNYHELLPDEEVPTELSFAEVAWKLAAQGRMVLIGWSSSGDDEDGDPVWELNPSDKLARRKWEPTDMLAALCRVDEEEKEAEGEAAAAAEPLPKPAAPPSLPSAGGAPP